MLKFDEFDAAEMSLSSFLIARGQRRAWTAIPVFPFRAFFHTYIFVRAGSSIRLSMLWHGHWPGRESPPTG